jgi:hypothetical protein
MVSAILLGSVPGEFFYAQAYRFGNARFVISTAVSMLNQKIVSVRSLAATVTL